MDKSDKLNVRVGTAGIQGVGTSGASCNGSLKVSNSSPLVSPTAPINMPRGLYNVDVAATFGVPLTTVGDLDVLTKGIEASKHEELLSGMTSDKRKAVMDALVSMCDSVQATNTNVDAIPFIQSVFIQDKPSSYIAAARGSRPKPSVAGGSKLDQNISKVFLEDGLSIIASQIGKPIMLDSYSSSICIESWGISSFARYLIKINAKDVLKESLTVGVPLIKDTGFTIETVSIPITVVTPNVPTPTVEMTNDGILYRVDGDDFYENYDELWFIVINNPFLKEFSLLWKVLARRRRQPQVRQTSVESSNLEKPDNPPIVTMADNRTMAQLLEDTTEVTRNAIVIPEITANNFEIKHVFLILSKQAIFWPMIKKTTCSNPFISTRYFYDEDSEVPNSSVKLMLFSFSLDRGSPDLAGKRTPSDD
ncbi:hypothetical protein Tco_0366623 [Tanacetum coccineum]